MPVALVLAAAGGGVVGFTLGKGVEGAAGLVKWGLIGGAAWLAWQHFGKA